MIASLRILENLLKNLSSTTLLVIKKKENMILLQYEFKKKIESSDVLCLVNPFHSTSDCIPFQ